MKKSGLFLASLLFSSPCFASLPPYWDTAMQINTVVNSAKLESKLKGTLTEIKLAGELTYEVRTQECIAYVVLTPHSPRGHIAGPTRYSVKEVRDVNCPTFPMNDPLHPQFP